REVLRRRLRRARAAEAADGEEQQGGWAHLPDLLIVDGGKGQLNAALEVLRELGLETLHAAGLALEEEILYVPDPVRGEPRSFGVYLPRSSPALFLVQRIRDEAHRFAVTYHRNLRRRRGLSST